MTKMSNLTVKGQVTIPKDVRDLLGLRPGEPVAFDRNAAGDVVIRKGEVTAAERARRRADMRARLDHVARKYAHLRTGRDTDEYMAELREPLPTPDPEDV